MHARSHDKTLALTSRDRGQGPDVRYLWASEPIASTEVDRLLMLLSQEKSSRARIFRHRHSVFLDYWRSKWLTNEHVLLNILLAPSGKWCWRRRHGIVTSEVSKAGDTLARADTERPFHPKSDVLGA